VSSDNGIEIQARDLTKTFAAGKGKQLCAVNGLSFEAQRGEVFGLLGMNGAGKTTTLRMLATMLTPTRGDAQVAGYSVTRKPEEVRRRIGFMSSATSLYGRLTAREMIAYFGHLHGMSNDRIARRTQELFTLLDMHAFADRRCDRLSSGMKQKVSIVRTVLHDPDVMILDEPTTGLDVLTSRVIVDFIKDCRARGRCVVLSTHIMSEVEKLADRVGVIHAGKLLSCETINDLRARTPGGRVEDAFIKLVEGLS